MDAIIGIAVAINILLVIWKFQHRPMIEGVVDGVLLMAVAVLFSGSTALLFSGTIGSAIVSLYLLFLPFKFGEADA